jgi:hypothetical protein
VHTPASRKQQEVSVRHMSDAATEHQAHMNRSFVGEPYVTGHKEPNRQEKKRP